MNNHLAGIILVSAGLICLVYACISFLKPTIKSKNLKRLLYPGVIGTIAFITGMTIVIHTTKKEILLTPYGFLKTTAER